MDFLNPEFWSFLWDAARYEAMIKDLGPWAPLLAIGAMVAVSFLPLPAETVAVANGMVFGRWEGFLFTWLGAMVAALIAFGLARWLGAPIIKRVLPKATLERFESLVEKKGAPFLLLARMIPFVPYTVVNYGSGLSPVRLSTYFWTSAIGMAPPIFAFVSVGALMTEQPWMGWIGLGAVILFCLLIGFYARNFFGNESAAD